jgi:diaminopimelate epimerase
MFQKGIAKKEIIKINAKGGELLVNFKKDNKKFNEIYLIGPADHIFSGKIKI